MNIKSELSKIGLNQNNSIVIGSGILQALGIRGSHDIDLVVTKEVFGGLKKTSKFKLSNNHRETISDDLFEIGYDWVPVDKIYGYDDLKKESVVIDDVRYITIEFLYKVKKIWIKTDKIPRQKDIEDIKLIEKYFDKSNCESI